jgi:4-aminobutyrate aminotransferase-like enzyme/Ser/Thr protein kinase RdoA (MazF antagonist)
VDDDELLRTPAPAFTIEQARQALTLVFGVEAAQAVALGSERDQMLALPDTSAGPLVLKISNRAENPRTLDMENRALAHLAAVDPELTVPRLLPTLDGGPVGSIVDIDGRLHLIRLMTMLPGRHAEGRAVSVRLAERIGDVVARVSVGLQGFFHERAGRRIDWDIRVRHPHVDNGEPRSARLAQARAATVDALAATLSLPSAVQHADLTLSNLLRGDGDDITGVIDFGDMHHTAAVCDLAVSLTAVLRNTAPAQPAPMVELAASFLDGYQRRRPLLPEEAAILGDLVLARLVTTLDISRRRAAEHPDNHEYIAQYDASSEALMGTLTDLTDEERGDLFARLAGLPTTSSTVDLAGRRDRVLGGRLAPMFYEDPVRLVSAEGPWLVGADGVRYLDAYNNVAVAGHTHPAVNQAVVRQLRTLNTHSRYLHPAVVELAERLTATMPAGLDTAILVTSGSEAVDLAWRLARAYTGGTGTVVGGWAYHGISTRTHDFSPNDWPAGGFAVDDVATFPAPHEDGSVLDRDTARARVRAAVGELAGRSVRPAVLMVDPQFTSEGILDAPAEFLHGLVDGIHEAGGLLLADEVQSGFGRSGPQLWRFALAGITPDIVTLGKPMGAGLPVAAVITRRDIADAFAAGQEYFSTFAGSPVACAAAIAVLDVLADRRIPDSAVRVGEYLRGQLRLLADDFRVLGAVRGYGLIAGVDLRAGGPPFAGAVVEGLRRHGVLAGRTGPRNDVLKVRPPLVWREEHVEEFVAALRGVLSGLAPPG